MYSITESFYDGKGVLRDPGDNYFDAEGIRREPNEHFFDYAGNQCYSGDTFKDAAGNYVSVGNYFTDSRGYRHLYDPAGTLERKRAEAESETELLRMIRESYYDD
jgi:hypothetical protein